VVWNRYRALVAAADRWLDHVFFAAMEVSTLVLPVLLLMLGAPPPSETSLAALSALAATVVAVATFRGGYLGRGGWPRPGHLGTMAGRAAVYAGVVAVGTYVGVWAQLVTGAFWTGILGPVAVAFPTLSRLPAGLDRLRELSQHELAALEP
jgi:hypothetical protein